MDLRFAFDCSGTCGGIRKCATGVREMICSGGSVACQHEHTLHNGITLHFKPLIVVSVEFVFLKTSSTGQLKRRH